MFIIIGYHEMCLKNLKLSAVIKYAMCNTRFSTFFDCYRRVKLHLSTVTRRDVHLWSYRVFVVASIIAMASADD